MHLIIAQPDNNEYAPFYAGYVAKALAAIHRTDNNDLGTALQATHRLLHELLSSLSEAQQHYRYAEGKWTVKEILGHLIDAERIFAYRVLRIARNDTTPLPGFDENAYVAASNAQKRSMEELLNEFAVVRASTLALLKSLSPPILEYTGTVSNHPISARALAYIIAGHELHHLDIIRERYLPAFGAPINSTM
jgi:uncharacterized damage-inducible protein DinB